MGILCNSNLNVGLIRQRLCVALHKFLADQPTTSFAFNMALTAPGFAFPPVSFMI